MLFVIAIITALIPIVALVSIVWIHSNKPESIWAIVLNEWQTLAAALIGFSAVATTLLLGSQVDRQEKHLQQTQLDWTVIYGIRADLRHLQEELDYILTEVTPTDDSALAKIDIVECQFTINRIRNFEYSDPAMTTILTSSGATLTPTIVPILTDAKRIQAYKKISALWTF